MAVFTMSKYRRAAKVDRCQPGIVKALRKQGISVQLGVDDIFVGCNGKNYWFELKDEEAVSKKTGEVLESQIKPSQKKLRAEWKGQYSIVSNLEQILEVINEVSER